MDERGTPLKSLASASGKIDLRDENDSLLNLQEFVHDGFVSITLASCSSFGNDEPMVLPTT